MFEPYAARTHEKMQDVLMKPEAAGPAIHYYMIRGGSNKRNVTIWETGTVGGEYIKTYGHYHVDDLPEVYWFVGGEGVALLQKMAVIDGKPQEDVLEEFKAIRVKAGDTLHIPPRYGHLVANVGKEWFVTIDDSPVSTDDSASMPAHADYKPVQRMQGFAYYVVEKDGVPALVKNPKYKEVRTTDFGGIPVIE
jgi:glucose-6-phosphate isomerase